MKYIDENGQQQECSCPDGAHSEILSQHPSLPSAEDLDLVTKENSIKENTQVTTEQPVTPATPATPAPKMDPTVAVMVDAMVTQLESALDMVKAPDYVLSTAKGFIDALKKWAEGGM